MTLTFAFVMDPLNDVNVRTDTSFAFMVAAQQRGHRVLHVHPSQGLSLSGDDVLINGQVVALRGQQGAHFHVIEEVALRATDCAAIMIRTDPPFDSSYLVATWLLSFAERRGVRVINSPTGIRSANEKLYAMEFPELCPSTMVTARRDAALQFVEAHGGEAIAKPLDGHGGFGVVRLRQGDSNLRALIELLTHEGREPMVVQQYLPAGAAGDKRLLLVDGEPRGAIMRVPAGGDHRGNVHVGGKAIPCAIDGVDRQIAATMRPALKRDGLFFVGLDVIDGKLIEVNVTSPTLVQELRDLGGPDLATEVVQAVEMQT